MNKERTLRWPFTSTSKRRQNDGKFEQYNIEEVYYLNILAVSLSRIDLITGTKTSNRNRKTCVWSFCYSTNR